VTALASHTARVRWCVAPRVEWGAGAGVTNPDDAGAPPPRVLLALCFDDADARVAGVPFGVSFTSLKRGHCAWWCTVWRERSGRSKGCQAMPLNCALHG
jgi:hypothetical protein